MPMVNFQEAYDNLDGLRSAIASLKGCTRDEVANETIILKGAMKRVEEMTTKTHSGMIEKRRMNLIMEADLTIARRAPVPAAEFPNS